MRHPPKNAKNDKKIPHKFDKKRKVLQSTTKKTPKIIGLQGIKKDKKS